MKKLFFAICFIQLLMTQALAKVTPVSGYENLQPQKNSEASAPIVHQVGIEEFGEFISDSLKRAIPAHPEDINNNIGYSPSLVSQQAKAEEQKSFFQQIYEQALNKVSQPTETIRDDIASATPPNLETQQQNWSEASGLPLVTAYLPPDNIPTSVPAMEHIPYLMNSIEVLPSGLVKFEETVVVVANGEKLSGGLTKILPQYVYNSEGLRQRLDYSVVGVRVNDMPVDYRLTSNGRNILLVPKDDYSLPPGIYTYKFEYVVDNLLWNYRNYYQLYWDVGGNGWNLVIDRLGASLNLPQPDAILSQDILLGFPSRLDNSSVTIRPNGATATAYIANRPLFIGEGMHLIANIDKEALNAPTVWQRVIRSFYNNGDVYLSLLCLIIIIFSFGLSWRYITKDKGQLKLKLNKTAMVSRLLMFDLFDIKSVCGFLLELYRKNIIDIQQSDNTVLLIKRTDNLKNLAKWQQKALKRLFPVHETVFNVNNQNRLPFRRFANDLEHGIRRWLWFFRLKLNMGYLLSGLAIVGLTEAFIAFLKIDSGYVFGVLCITSLICMAAIMLWNGAHRKWLKIISRLFAIDIIILCFIVFSAVVHFVAALFLIASLWGIATALNIYGRRLGLIKHYIQDTARFRDYLLENRDNLVLSRSAVNHQALIWALDLEKDFASVTGENYKIPAMQTIAAMWK